jgi:hypothetical protein
MCEGWWEPDCSYGEMGSVIVSRGELSSAW